MKSVLPLINRLSQYKVAIVHDQLATPGGAGGAERVLALVKSVLPNATVYTTVYNPKRMPPEFQNWGIRTTFIQNLPFAKTKYHWYLPLMPAAIEELDMTSYDVVLSFSHSVAKGVITSPSSVHICYCYSPLRYAWDKYHEYVEYGDVGGLIRYVLPFVMRRVREWDVVASMRVDAFATLSHFVARRIKKFYRRESTVIHPPCRWGDFYISSRPEDFYLVVSRLVAYKRIDLAIEACNKLGRRLVIIGEGSDRRRLERIAGPSISFLGRLTDPEIANYYARCKAFLFPGEEDYGITPLEAQASGRPVIAYGSGGALETVRGFDASEIQKGDPKHTGLFFREQTAESLMAAIEAFESTQHILNPKVIRDSVSKYSETRFLHQFFTFVLSQMEKSA